MLWAIVSGFVVQTLWGLFATLLCFFLLAAADTDRCPVAAPRKPFFGFIAGVVLANITFEWSLMWGIFFDVRNPIMADPFLFARNWHRKLAFGEQLRWADAGLFDRSR